ncbi:MAG: alpha/beta hydrolase [Chloroflexota bacterium]
MSRIPLALLPGTLCSAALWEAQAVALSGIADVRIIDTSQHGNLPALARHVHSVMPTRFAVAGLSYGGIVAFAVWRHKPQAISHLALMNTTPLPITPAKKVEQLNQVEAARSGRFQEIVANQAGAILSLVDRQNDGAFRSKIISMAEEVGIDGFANQIHAQINRPDSRADLEQMQCPTLVLCGEQDAFCLPEIHEEMANKIPRSMLQVIPQCGHLSSLEQPEHVARAMRSWLKS